MLEQRRAAILLLIMFAILLGFLQIYGSSVAAELRSTKGRTLSHYDHQAQKWLDKFYTDSYPLYLNVSRQSWAWSTNITDHNEAVKTEASLVLSNYSSRVADEAYKTFNLSLMKDHELKRLIDKVQRSRIGSTPAERKLLSVASNKLSTIYSTATICPAHLPANCEPSKRVPLTPNLDKVFKESRNETELKIVWKRWRDVSGKPSRDLFFELIDNTTRYENRLGYKSVTEKWLYSYESDDPNFRDNLWQLFRDILPFYEDLHAYVRFKLNKFYGPSAVTNEGTIPAHILGNMWAQTWGNIFDIVKPYPDAGHHVESVTESMEKGNWTALKIFEAAESFFTSLGMPNLPKSFWTKSLIEKPTDGRKVVCHASAWDMIAKRDVRIKMCTEINAEDLGVVHHELGHIYYYLAYENQTIIFREGANPGFHEAVGDTIFLSSNQDLYLKHLKLLPEDHVVSDEEIINKQLEKALDGIAFFPFGYLTDLWRWDIFDQVRVTKKVSNAHWWSLRNRFQGVHAPVPREDDDFDPASKYHVANFVPYIRYFVARFLQYQFHDSLCEEVEAGGDTSTCSIFGNKKAGEKLWKMLKLGASVPWPEALKTVTGSKTMSAKAVLKFYAKLRTWLRQENVKNGVCIGWGAKWPKEFELQGPRCPPQQR